MCRRRNNHPVIAVRTIATTRQTSHAGKKEPKISKEGARVQLVSNSVASASPYGIAAVPPQLRLRKRFMVEISAGLLELHRQSGRPNSPLRSAPAYGPARQWSGPAPVSSVLK